MLFELYIENVAVVERAEISFDSGLTVLTGETGAGKSVIINSLNAVLGQKVNKDVIRHGCDKAYISARFSGISARQWARLADFDIEQDDGEVIISREITASGRSTAKINGRPVGLSVLQEIGLGLVNIHGQHDNQQLLDEASHLGILDRLGEYDELLFSYRDLFGRLAAQKKQLDEITKNAADREQRIDFLEYQIKEIEAAKIIPGELERLADERKLLMHAEKISAAAAAVRARFSGDGFDSGIEELLGLSIKDLRALSGSVKEAGAVCEKLDEALVTASEAVAELGELEDRAQFDPARLEEIEERLAAYDRLRRKYGDSEEDILAQLAKMSAEHATLVGQGDDGERLAAELEVLIEEAAELAERLSRLRRDTAEKFTAQVRDELEFLEMPGVRLVASFEKTALSRRGMDKLVFLISSNPGEPPKSISKIASGGELSRIMLAIKSVLAKTDEVESLVFDEIDAGVSGRTAAKIGLKLSRVAADRQVICVTHLAQIAAYGRRHLLIQKAQDGGRTATAILPLDDEGRISELARILGGQGENKMARENACELLSEAQGRQG